MADFTLLMDLCGLPLLLCLSVVTLLTTALAIRMICLGPNPTLLAASFPIMFAPLAVGIVSCFLRLLRSLASGLTSSSTGPIDPVLMLQSSLLPLALSAAAVLPGVLLVGVGRFAAVLKHSEANLLPKRKRAAVSEADEQQAAINQRLEEADEYLNRLGRRSEQNL
ncbi:MAG: hypothetical protein AAF958_02570 [Planctomycetota bacterium]